MAISLQALDILIVRKLVEDIQRLRSEAEVVVVPPLCPVESSAYDVSRCDVLVQRAMAQTATWIAQGVEMVDVLPHQLPVHRH